MSERMHGVVLTYVENLDVLADAVQRGSYDTVKVVTGWGVEGGWNEERRRRVLEMVPHVIVRTVAGDPSYAGGSKPFPRPEEVEQEIAPWYALRPNIFIEIGNEPNINQPDDEFIWQYRFFLAAAVQRCRAAFPKAQLIAGGLILREAEQFLAIPHDAMDDCDYIGIHVYEYYGFHAAQQKASTRDLKKAVELHMRYFAEKPWFITEYGINDSKEVTTSEKGLRYASMVHQHESHPILPDNVEGAVYYHLGTKGDLHPEYHIYPEGDDSYGMLLSRLSRGLPETTDLLTSLMPQISQMIADLSQHEHELKVRRANAGNGNGSQQGFTVEDELALMQVRALQATLESALACIKDDALIAEELADAAESLMLAWSDRKESLEDEDDDDDDEDDEEFLRF